MHARQELAVFALVLGTLVSAFFAESLFGGKVLSPADVLFASASFREVEGSEYDPANRLLIDPVLQFQPWLEFNRTMLRQWRLPLWNDASGCGTPHLANGQSAPFDPFHLIAYLGKWPDALAWMAFARLWFAGMGMFLLARGWGLGVWGRWFAGLTYPFCGFLVVWLLFPVTNVAVWMPWLFLATDRVLERSDPRGVGLLGFVVGGVFLGGHIQTSAHVLLAAGLYVAWRYLKAIRLPIFPRSITAWGIGVLAGLMLASISILPLWVYLGKSPVWGDRDRERPSPRGFATPRLLDGICNAVPYAFGSQRRGHPNLARALGVHNLNESAGGFAGLATLGMLVPLAWRARRSIPVVGFLAGLAAFGFLGAFEYPPVINLLRALPVINVTDHRRLVLWVAFALTLLGGIGLDNLATGRDGSGRPWRWVMLAMAALCAVGALALTRAEPWISSRAIAHYARAAERTEGADPEVYRRRAERQVAQTLAFTPTVLLGTAAELSALVFLALLLRRGSIRPYAAKGSLLALTLAESFAFGYGLNPAIDRGENRPWPEVLVRLREEMGKTGRILGVGAELPPNVAMRYGLADVRNYDSVESSRSLAWFEPLYEPSNGSKSSRRTITWAGVARARERLKEASVAAVVGPSAPPEGIFERVERIGDVWVVRLEPFALVTSTSMAPVKNLKIDNGSIEFVIESQPDDITVVRQSFDSGWKAFVDGVRADVVPYKETFLAVKTGAGGHRVVLIYDPIEVRVAGASGLFAFSFLVFALTAFRPFRSSGILCEGLGVFQVVGVESIE